jgi:diphthamide biosynthesis protein 3
LFLLCLLVSFYSWLDRKSEMAEVYEEVEIEDMDYNADTQEYSYPCPCGDKFSIALEELYDGDDIALCPSCTLRIRVIFDEDALPPLNNNEEVEGDDVLVVASVPSADTEFNKTAEIDIAAVASAVDKQVAGSANSA